MTNMTANEFLKAVDHAAGMNDRLLLLGGGMVIYWLVRQLQLVLGDHKELREAHHTALAQIIEKQSETSLKLAVCIDHNTAALNECAFELRRFQEGASRTGQ
jgi:hypothetical protein